MSARRPTVCLSMIVRNEAHVVREALESAVPYLDTWVVVDTGSTDDTIEVIRSFFAARGIPGTLHERPWRDFGTNRTEALGLCRGRADYAWVLDADDIVVGPLDLSALEADSYIMRYGADFRYWRKQLFRTSLPWEYRGAVHEYAVSLAAASEARLQGAYHIESRRLGDRSRAPDKYLRDAEILLRELGRDPSNSRNVFYLAQSYRDAGDVRRAIGWYGRRAELEGWAEEVFYSLLRRAECLAETGAPWETVVDAFLASWEASPWRAEPLHELARRCREQGRYELAYLFASRAAALPYPEQDVLFVQADVYTWKVTDELSIAAYYTGHHRESFELCSQLLAGTALPEEQRTRVEGNRDFSAPAMEADAIAYPDRVVRRIERRRPRRSEAVTFTITSCRRPALFEQTVASFLNCCEDVGRIDRWICVDDGSTPDDRAYMQERFPFFEFVLKGADDRGHAQSMNILRDLVASRYWLHLEDDWTFFAPARYVSDAIAILRDDPAIGQVLFNRNYAETLAQREVVGGVVRATRREGLRHRLHVHAPAGTSEYERISAELGSGAQSMVWWPHFSLRPSLMKTSAIRDLGPFRAESGHFELDFAWRYAAAGYMSAFFDTVCCRHSGRLTSERGDLAQPNAYELNGVLQFVSTAAVARPLSELAACVRLGALRLEGAAPIRDPSIVVDDGGYRLTAWPGDGRGGCFLVALDPSLDVLSVAVTDEGEPPERYVDAPWGRLAVLDDPVDADADPVQRFAVLGAGGAVTAISPPFVVTPGSRARLTAIANRGDQLVASIAFPGGVGIAELGLEALRPLLEPLGARG